MLWWPSAIKLFLLLLYTFNFATITDCNVNMWYSEYLICNPCKRVAQHPKGLQPTDWEPLYKIVTDASVPVFYFIVLKIEHRTSPMLGRYCATELHTAPALFTFYFDTSSHWVDPAGFELEIILPQFPEYVKLPALDSFFLCFFFFLF